MKPSERRQLYKKETADRQRENYANKDDSGRFGDYYNDAEKAKVKLWKCKEDDHEIIMIPYIVGDQHPRLAEGKVDFVLDVFVHRKVGINEDNYICLNRTYKKPCPICDYQAKLKDDDEPDKDVIKALNPTRRNLFNIVCMDSQKEIDLGIQVWDVSQWLFTNPLEELAHKKKGGGEVMYADVDEGKIISFRKKGTGVTSTEYTAFEFKDREEVPDEILESAVCLDQLIHIPTYEEVSAAFFGTSEDEKPETKPKEEKPKLKKSDEKPKEEPPPQQEKKSLKKKEEDVPADKGNPPEKEEEVLECPGGAAFGADYNDYEECRSCELRKKCSDKKDELTAVVKEPEPPPKKKLLTRRDK